MTVARIDVASARRTYPVLVGSGLLAGVDRLLEEHSAADPTVVSVPPVWRYQGSRLAKTAGSAGPVLMSDGERAKTLQAVSRLYDAFCRRHVGRSSTIVAFGGGVVGDVAGFAAATYLRGVSLVQVPTTLLAQVDSSVGGKVGVNLPAGKNLAGAFHPPILVLVDTDVLATLPGREFRAGMFEVVKYGVIASAALLDRVATGLDAIFANDGEALTPIIADSIRIKAAVVAEDEREAGPRRVLNFGHTIGHALEAVTRFTHFRHGEAVGYGMLAALRISTARGLIAADDEQRVGDLIQRLGPLPTLAGLHQSDVLNALAHDKKIADGKLHMVLSRGMGDTVIVSDVSRTELSEALTSIGVVR